MSRSPGCRRQATASAFFLTLCVTFEATQLLGAGVIDSFDALVSRVSLHGTRFKPTCHTREPSRTSMRMTSLSNQSVPTSALSLRRITEPATPVSVPASTPLGSAPSRQVLR